MFANENAFDAIVQSNVQVQTWPFDDRTAMALVKAIIGTESGFNPGAYRAEPQINDASRGLMQVLANTARSLGYGGDVGDDATHTGGLYDPYTNVGLGAKLLAQNLRAAGGNWNTAISGYNQGMTRALADAATGGPYRNAPYVNRVLTLFQYFSRASAPPRGPTPAIKGMPATPGIWATLVRIFRSWWGSRGSRSDS